VDEMNTNEKLFIEMLQHTVMNSKVAKGIMNRQEPMDIYTLEDILNSELKKAFETHQTILLEMMNGKREDDIKELKIRIMKGLGIW
jgi:hypothetical protein